MRANQRGSILGFLIVGGALALLLVGGAYLVRHTLSSNDETARELTTSPNTSSEDAPRSSEDKTATSDDAAEHSDEQSTTKQPIVGNPSSEQPNHTAEQEKSSTDASTANTLPQTGPADIVASGVLLSGVVGVAVAYKRSRDATLPL